MREEDKTKRQKRHLCRAADAVMVSCPEWGKGQQFEEIRRINGKSMDCVLVFERICKSTT